MSIRLKSSLSELFKDKNFALTIEKGYKDF